MKADIVALLVGVLVAALLAVAYFAPPYLHVPINPLNVLAVGVILTVGISLAALVRSTMTPPGLAHTGRMSTYSPLNEYPVLRFVAQFNDPEFHTTTLTITPGDMSADVLARYAEVRKAIEKDSKKRLLLVLKSGRKKFNPLELKTIFSGISVAQNLYHLLLHDENDKLVVYLPVDGCWKDFTGDTGESKITKCVVETFADPKFTADAENKNRRREMIYTMKGATFEDTVEETLDIREAARKMRDNEKLQNLIVTRKSKPIGAIDKQSILTLSTTGA